MSVYMYVLGPCYGCKRLFTYNADRVPSLTIAGTREPFCADCIERANVRRAVNGLDLIVPLPGAYEPEEL